MTGFAEYDSAIALVIAANIAFDSAIDSYRQGVGTFTDAVSTSTEKAHAQSELANAYAKVLIAAASLAFSTGELTSIDAIDNQSALLCPGTQTDNAPVSKIGCSYH